MGAVSTAHADTPAVMLLFSILEFSAALPIPVFSVHEVEISIFMTMPGVLDVLDSNILQNSSWCLPGVR